MGTIASLIARLAGRRIYLDSNIFVYFLDRHPQHFSRVAPLFEAAATRAFQCVTGDAAVAEVMVKPYASGDPALIAAIKSFFATPPLEVMAHSAECFDLAAQLRARHGLRFIDALHLATAMQSGCAAIVSNDAGMRPTSGIEVVRLPSSED